VTTPMLPSTHPQVTRPAPCWGQPPKPRKSRDQHGLINEATQKSVAGLVVLRNLAAHAPDRVSAEEALEFVALAEATQYAITAKGTDRGPGPAGA
jgi:hypothetical protein